MTAVRTLRRATIDDVKPGNLIEVVRSIRTPGSEPGRQVWHVEAPLASSPGFVWARPWPDGERRAIAASYFCQNEHGVKCILVEPAEDAAPVVELVSPTLKPNPLWKGRRRCLCSCPLWDAVALTSASFLAGLIVVLLVILLVKVL